MQLLEMGPHTLKEVKLLAVDREAMPPTQSLPVNSRIVHSWRVEPS